MLILFQGDGITGGVENDTASAAEKKYEISEGDKYRNESGIRYDSAGHGYPYIISSALGYRYPQRGFCVLNVGKVGDRVENLFARWQDDTIANEPDILSILIGSNDAEKEYLSNQKGIRFDDRFEETYSLLLSYAKAANPALRLVLLEPFMLDSGNMGDEYPARYLLLEKRRDITSKLAKRYGAVFIPLQEYFDRMCARMQANYWIYDSIHPTASGHGLISDAWLEATKDYLGITYP